MKRTLLLIFVGCMSKMALGSIVFAFSGYINAGFTNANDAIPGIVSGQPFSGWLSYSIVADQNTNTRYGYYHQPTSISVSIGTDTYSYLNDHVYIRVTNYNEDVFQFGVDGRLNEQISFTRFGIKLTDSSGLVFDSDELPLDLNLSDFDSLDFDMSGSRYTASVNRHDQFNIPGTITSLTLTPEPLTLITMALGGLFIRKKV